MAGGLVLLGVLLGGVVSFATAWHLDRRRERRETAKLAAERSEKRREERLTAYVEFATASSRVAFAIGALFAGRTESDSARAASDAFGLDALPAYYAVQLVGTSQAKTAAMDALNTLGDFRRGVADPFINSAIPAVRPENYKDLEHATIEAQKRFIEVTRAERTGASADATAA